jgi:hypothetical protein
MFETKNLLKGFKPLEQQQKELEKDPKNDPFIFKLPAELFVDFEEIDQNNDEMFEYVAYNLVIEYLERVCLKVEAGISEAASLEERYKNVKWDTALEFPDNLASMGRSKLHEVANFFNLAHHSRGPKNKTGAKKHRWFLLYPKTLFTDK